MTIKELKEVIEFRISKVEKELKEAEAEKNEYLGAYCKGKLIMLNTLKHDIVLDIKGGLLEAIFNEAN